MTRPVADILAEAERDGWPTSYIDAMANHHLCGSRPYVNDSTGDAAPREDGQADARQDGAPHGSAGAPSACSERNLMAAPNCGRCHGTGWRRPSTNAEAAHSGGDDVRCGCQAPASPSSTTAAK